MAKLHIKSGLFWRMTRTSEDYSQTKEATFQVFGLSVTHSSAKHCIKTGGKMANYQSNLWKGFILSLFLAVGVFSKSSAACTNVTPSFSYSKNRTCGSPVTITLTNTSTGNSSALATYRWSVGGTLIKQVVGKAGQSYTINTPGTYVFKLHVTDTGASPCKDSVTQTVTITANSPKIIDGNGIATYSPNWENCISTSGTPDTFGLVFKPDDSLKNYKIIWGDGSSNDTGSLLLKTQQKYHKYNSLGIFSVTIIAKNGSCVDTLKGTVSNERNPVAGLIGPPTGTNSGCVPITIRFINNSIKSSPSTTFTWDFGDGQTLTKASNTYKDTLFYTYKRFICNGIVKLTMSNACGSSFATWNPIQASSKDSAIIAPANPTNCNLSTAFQFNNTSQNRYCVTPSSKKYKWIWGDGTNSGWLTTTASQSKTYSARGNYTILLIDSNGCGKDTGRYTLRIDSMPKANATATPVSGCSPLEVQFTDLSSSNSTSRSWAFGDGSTSSVAAPKKLYTVGGNYKAILTVANNCGNSKDTIDIKVKQKVKAQFGNISGGCKPFVAKFTNTSVVGLAGTPTYKWDFGDGTTSTQTTPPDKTYNTNGTYTVTLIATDSCGSDTFKRTFIIRDKPTATINITSSGKCVNSPIDFYFETTPVNTATVIYGNNTANTQFFGLGGLVKKTVTATYDSAKTYIFRIYLVDPSGCNDTVKFPVTIDPRPTMNFTSSVNNGCGPLNVAFTNTSAHNGGGNINQMTFKWNFGNGTSATSKDSAALFQSFKTRDTIYRIKLIGTNSFGCKDSITKGVRVYPKPLSKFILDKRDGCAPLTVNTTNQSVPYDTGSIAIMKFEWSFGNGSNAYHQDSTAKYVASKTRDTVYNVRLIAISEHGCRDTSFSSVTIYPKPKSRFAPSVSSGCPPLAVSFNNTSTPFDTGSISIMSFTWDFGNKVASSSQQTSTVYDDFVDKDTTYTVRLIAQSEHGCKDTSVTSILVHPKPRAVFSPNRTNGCGPLSVNFTDNSVNANTYEWNFGAYGTATTKNVTKVFYGRDIFDSIVTIQLVVKSSFGCVSDTNKQKVTVLGQPIANYLVSKDTFCFPDEMQFLNQSLAAYSYKWDLGDGTQTTVTNPRHYFSKSGSAFNDTTYFINLVATSPYGCKDTARGTMTVLPYPIPRFIIDKPAGCAPHTVQFTNQSVNVKNYLWVFGDGYTSTAANPSHTYINTGPNDTAYQAILYTYSVDCIDSVSIWIPVYKPTFTFFRTDRVNPCDAGYFQMNNFSENYNSVFYNFGDGTTSTQTDPLHLFPTSPYRDTSFTIKFYSSSARGCTDSFSRSVTLPQRLSIGMKDTSWALCAPALVQFTNYTRGAITYIWSFGDNGGSSQFNPLYEYQKPGIYNYSLYAFDANGCKDSIKSIGTVRVDASPKADYDFSPGKGRMPNDNRIFFTDKSRSTIPLTYKWDFSDPAGIPAIATTQNASHDFSDSGDFNVCLMVNNGGCSDTFCNIIRIDPPFPEPDFSVDKDSGCPPLTVQFTNLSTNSDRYIWFFGDGERSEEKDPKHTYKYSGYYDVVLIAKGPGGEGRTEKKQFIKVLNAPYTFFNLTPSVLYLPNAIFSTRNLTSGAITYNWNVYYNKTGANVGNSTKENPYFQVYDTGYYDVELISMSNQGCYDTLYVPMPIYVNPTGKVHIPDAFTPTKDDRNEIFKPVALNLQKEFYQFQIFNRWGELMFETKDPEQGWDGTYKGKYCQDGVYVYKMNAKLYNGDDVQMEGIVHLIR